MGVTPPGRALLWAVLNAAAQIATGAPALAGWELAAIRPVVTGLRLRGFPVMDAPASPAIAAHVACGSIRSFHPAFATLSVLRL